MTTYTQETEEERIEREQATQDTDNFDAIWARLKQSIRERREPNIIYTMNGNLDRDHARFDTGYCIDEDDDGRQFVGLHVGWSRGNAMAYARRADLINIAEHCLLRAAQMTKP